jgi:hypothetical protein
MTRAIEWTKTGGKTWRVTVTEWRGMMYRQQMPLLREENFHRFSSCISTQTICRCQPACNAVGSRLFGS